ncbi:hypothetical protein [Anaeromicropila populeti]|uniref:Uncharacterized protein n=1 Tax=Anaeromicropila populeti TaxID=37658 RepID=A0A1I6IAR4_9FIRM|nr:hypothetical protein [Anaeromicropila populeti]SFR63842.1 hypothetical protein SAMN05661086_00634 [Anaeromicropila populeti]
MAFPIVSPPTLSQSQLINSLTEAEAGIAQCLADFLCNEFFPEVNEIEDITEQTELVNKILCAYSCKEKAMGTLIDALADLVLADKGISPCGDSSEGCKCDC